MSYENFIEKQERIYDKFRDTSAVEKEGLIPKIPKQQGGYLIAFRHPKKITDSLGNFSNIVSRLVPAIVYDEQNAHTSLSDFQVQDNFSPNIDTLKQLTTFFYENRPSSDRKIIINYGEWLFNQNTSIAAGRPNKSFYDLTEKVVNNAEQNGIQLRLPWGAHITTNRFLEKISPECVQDFLNLFKTEKPLGLSNPSFLDVGYFIFTPKGFDYHIFERFTLT